MQFRISYW